MKWYQLLFAAFICLLKSHLHESRALESQTSQTQEPHVLLYTPPGIGQAYPSSCNHGISMNIHNPCTFNNVYTNPGGWSREESLRSVRNGVLVPFSGIVNFIWQFPVHSLVPVGRSTANELKNNNFAPLLHKNDVSADVLRDTNDTHDTILISSSEGKELVKPKIESRGCNIAEPTTELKDQPLTPIIIDTGVLGVCVPELKTIDNGANPPSLKNYSHITETVLPTFKSEDVVVPKTTNAENPMPDKDNDRVIKPKTDKAINEKIAPILKGVLQEAILLTELTNLVTSLETIGKTVHGINAATETQQKKSFDSIVDNRKNIDAKLKEDLGTPTDQTANDNSIEDINNTDVFIVYPERNAEGIHGYSPIAENYSYLNTINNDYNRYTVINEVGDETNSILAAQHVDRPFTVNDNHLNALPSKSNTQVSNSQGKKNIKHEIEVLLAAEIGKDFGTLFNE